VDEQTGGRVFFKCENFQRAGAFKFRGAYHALARLDRDQQRRGVVAYSSGNHAQAVALAGRMLGIPCVIVMPSDAPPVKRAATAEYGAEIVLYDREHENREAIGQRIAAERRLAVIPPFDHPLIVAGAGTVAHELIDESGPLDLLLTPCGGGGLVSGCSLVAEALSPGCRTIGVEPTEGDDAKRSLETRTLQTVHNPRTVADGARTASLGTITLPLVLDHVSTIVTVDDAALLRTMFFLWERLKLVVEPTGALAAAALLTGKVDGRGRRVGVILSGGNVDFSQVETWRRMI
jgi:threo-3-hydroxy-L-aspartate ammonia-lyase